MQELFDSRLIAIQSEMVAVCLDYADHQVDGVYLITYRERGLSSADFCFRVGGAICRRSKLNEVCAGLDVGEDAQWDALRAVLGGLEQIADLCDVSDRPCPTLIRINYRVDLQSMESTYEYDQQIQPDGDTLPSDLMDSWFETLDTLGD